ncbi:hypothetical protein HELRODRAFT_168134 [Helobdella robusta]|uniref:Endonuclease/exonuclease/phosphatase domain-containing protein n=1 Tax=Helobdella robusta TaxID=6412 RepID=T1F075_HELRO|nr:hypothetical protein HELRODRAFT_168134 [Helobdella robusta]ESO10244.1 hypothetical protein HELRODRAFT_168134 [Helobdella robusta]
MLGCTGYEARPQKKTTVKEAKDPRTTASSADNLLFQINCLVEHRPLTQRLGALLIQCSLGHEINCNRTALCASSKKARPTAYNCSIEIVDMLERRRVDICSLQETRWKSNGVPLIGSYKLFWNSQKTAKMEWESSYGNNWQKMYWKLLSNQLTKLRIGNQALTIFSAYAPQTDESENAKNDFWNTLSDAVR